MLTTALSEKAGRVLLLIMAFIAVTAALHYAKPVVAPVVFALVVGVVVSPLAERLSKLGIPSVAIAVTVLLVATALVGAAVLLINPLVGTLVDQLPRIRQSADELLDTLSNMLRGIETITKEIEDSVGAEPVDPQGGIPSVRDALWLAPNFAAQVFIFMGTLFFFVLTRDDLYASAGEWKDRLGQADRAVARYFGAVAAVNAGLGTVTGLVLMALGVEYAALWGLLAGVLNFILYLGPILMIGGLLLAGLVQFSGAMSFLPPVAFLLINLAEAQFVTPLVVGRRLQLSPLVVFLAIVFGLWLWGPVGAIVALPVLLWLGVLMRPDVIERTRAKLRRRYSRQSDTPPLQP